MFLYCDRPILTMGIITAEIITVAMKVLAFNVGMVSKQRALIVPVNAQPPILHWKVVGTTS